MSALKKHQPYPIKQAFDELSVGQGVRYKVVTINGTLASDGKGGQRKDKVYRNEYSFTLRNLIKFIRETYEVAEDVISVEREN
ncbi:MAG: hypothetical protein NTW46_03530 [Candidatus Nealsonbacteria bacterium]|nr:hypothetical protein [Candidatus Nealsonbacteria bacterium]